MKVKISPISLTNPQIQSHPISTEVQIARSQEFTKDSIVRSYFGEYCTEVEFEDIKNSGEYYIRSRHEDRDFGVSPWSDSSLFRIVTVTAPIVQTKDKYPSSEPIEFSVTKMSFSGIEDTPSVTYLEIDETPEFSLPVYSYNSTYKLDFSVNLGMGDYYVRAKHYAPKVGFTYWSDVEKFVSVKYTDFLFSEEASSFTVPFSHSFQIHLAGGGGGSGLAIYDGDPYEWQVPPTEGKGEDTIVYVNDVEVARAKGGRGGDSVYFYTLEVAVPGEGTIDSTGFDPHGMGGYGIQGSTGENYDASERRSYGRSAEDIYLDLDLKEGDVVSVKIGKGGKGLVATWPHVSVFEEEITEWGTDGTDGYAFIKSNPIS